jgi:hypothetical protein
MRHRGAPRTRHSTRAMTPQGGWAFSLRRFFCCVYRDGDWAEHRRESFRVGAGVSKDPVEIFVLQVQDVRAPQERHEHEGYANGVHDAGDSVIV